MHWWKSSIAHTLCLVLRHTVNIFCVIALVHLFKNKPLPPSPVGKHPQSAEKAQIYHYSNLLLGNRGTHTYSENGGLRDIETFALISYPLTSTPSHTHSLTVSCTYTHCCVSRTMLGKLCLTFDRTWNIETIEHREPSFYFSHYCLTSKIFSITMLQCSFQYYVVHPLDDYITWPLPSLSTENKDKPILIIK